jgi:peroxiredoxin
VEELYKEFGDRIEFIGINLGTEKDLNNFIKKHHLTFPITYDRGNRIASLFDAKIETNILIDRKGIITFKEKGFRDDMKQYLRKLIQEDPRIK